MTTKLEIFRHDFRKVHLEVQSDIYYLQCASFYQVKNSE